LANISPEQIQIIIQALEARGVRRECPRCGNLQFTIADGYFSHPVQKDLNSFNIGGPSIPSIVLVCTRCGFMSQHALGVIGLLPAPVEKKQGDKTA
jgi:ribosomal protein S27AE